MSGTLYHLATLPTLHYFYAHYTSHTLSLVPGPDSHIHCTYVFFFKSVISRPMSGTPWLHCLPYTILQPLHSSYYVLHTKSRSWSRFSYSLYVYFSKSVISRPMSGTPWLRCLPYTILCTLYTSSYISHTKSRTCTRLLYSLCVGFFQISHI